MNNLPFFFNYEAEGPTDNGYETIQDFFISWTLRCAKEEHRKDNFLINHYSRRILFSLLYGKHCENDFVVNFDDIETFKIIEVNTKRQYKRIDLIALLKIEINNKIENYILNIENKWYTKIGEHQLSNYVQTIHSNFNIKTENLINIVIFCDESILMKDRTQIDNCLRNQYKYTHIAKLASLAQMEALGKTGNYLFDEYWFNL